MTAAATALQPLYGSGSSTGEALTTLLTAEGLVLVAIGISVSIAGGSAFGTKWLISPGWLAAISTGFLVAIAIGAGFAWVGAWTGCHWPADLTGQVAGLALAVGVVAPPVLSLIVTINVWR